MNKIYVVSYDFKGSPAAYPAFFEELKCFPAWCHYLDGTWLVATDLSSKAIFNRLRPHLDENVNVLILEAAGDFSGWLPKKAWEWIQQHTAERTAVKAG